MYIFNRGEIQTGCNELLLGSRIIIVGRIPYILAISSIVDLIIRVVNIVTGEESQFGFYDIAVYIEGNALGLHRQGIDSSSYFRGEIVIFQVIQESFSTDGQAGSVVSDIAF